MSKISSNGARLVGLTPLPYLLIALAVIAQLWSLSVADPSLAGPSTGAAGAEQTAPQEPGSSPGDEDQNEAHPPGNSTNEGVITPPPTGDKDIETTVPDPNAGTNKDVVPPPSTPRDNPDIEPR